MSRRSGKYAYVDGIPCTQGWGFGRTSTASRYFASCVPGASGASEGVLDETGSVNGLGYLPPIPNGEDFDFVGVASAKAGQLLNWVGDILISDTTLQMPIAAGTPITWTSNFGVQGQLTKETATAYEDDTRLPAASAKNCKIAIESVLDSGVFTDVDRVQNATLTFRMPASTSVNVGVTERDPGNLEVDLSFEVHNDDMDVALYALNSVKRVRVYVTATLFYLLDAVMWQAHSNYRVDRSQNPPPIIGYTVNGLWTALRTQDPPALGQILLPGGSTLYPLAEESS